MEDIKIQRATIKDLKEIQLLNKKLFDEEFKKYDKTLNCNWPLSKEGGKFYKERILEDNGCAFILLKNQEPIGYLVASLSKSEFYRNLNNFVELDDMYILKKYRGKGYGKLLYAKFIQWCKDRGVKRLKVLVTVKNRQGINFYRERGFKDYTLILENKL